jgi:hypothetical protein
MKWSFIISYLDGIYLDKIIDSIKNQTNLTKSKFEIILVGPNNESLEKNKSKVNYNIVFEETIVPGWITMKKNLGVQNAKYENVCVMHDYIALCENWYTGYLQFGDDWDVCSNPIRTTKGNRYWDWITLNRPIEYISYNDLSQTKTNMYVGGSYMCVKRKFMLENPLDYRRVWGQGEDVEWAYRCKDKWNYTLNTFSVVRLLKDKEITIPDPSTDPNKNVNYNTCKVQT